MQTISVRPTQAGDKRYFVVTNSNDGRTSVDAVPFSRLTAVQKRMVQGDR